MSLNERALLVNLMIHQWTNQKTDSKAKQAVTDKFELEQNHDRYVKSLVAPEALQLIRIAAGRLRVVHTRYTLPWQDNGVRILPSMSFMKYTEAITEARNAFERATSEFIEQYPRLKAAAIKTHKALYNEADYPTEIQLRAMFGTEVNYLPFPDVNDFRIVGDAGELIEKMKVDMQQSYQKATKDAVDTFLGGLVARLEGCIGTLEIIREPTLDALRGQIELLPSMNLTNDPKINDAYDALTGTLRGATAEDLRKDSMHRATVFTGFEAAIKMIKERA